MVVQSGDASRVALKTRVGKEHRIGHSATGFLLASHSRTGFLLAIEVVMLRGQACTSVDGRFCALASPPACR
eukprot:2935041-Pyramimonas_sp.AAC.1